jgi:hypothetical protein
MLRGGPQARAEQHLPHASQQQSPLQSLENAAIPLTSANVRASKLTADTGLSGTQHVGAVPYLGASDQLQSEEHT